MSGGEDNTSVLWICIRKDGPDRHRQNKLYDTTRIVSVYCHGPGVVRVELKDLPNLPGWYHRLLEQTPMIG